MCKVGYFTKNGINIHRSLKSKQDLKIKRDYTGPCDIMQLLDIENEFLYVFYKCPDSTVKRLFFSKYLESSIFMAVGSNPGKTFFLVFFHRDA